MTDINIASSTRDVTLVELMLISSNGKKFDLKNPVSFNVLNIYEDIYSSVVSGSIRIIDNTGQYSYLGIHGNEFLKVVFHKSGQPEEKYSKTFRVYKACERTRSGTSQAQTYILYFCSEELIFSNQQIISRSLSGNNAAEYAYKICSSDLKINKNKIKTENFEKSSGPSEFVLTRYTPIEAIEYLAAHSYNNNESTFMFFENINGFNFMSLESLFSGKLITKLKYNTAILTEEQETAAHKNSNLIADFNFKKVFNILENTKTTSYAGKLYTLDLITQKYNRFNYSFLNNQNKKNMMDGYFPLNDAKNRNGNSLYEEYNTSINFWLTNKGRTNNPYFISKNIRSNDTNIERILLQRKTQLNMLRNTEFQCTVPINPLLSTGFMVEIDLPSFSPSKESERILDPYMKGKYLITGTKHTITPDGGSQTTLTLNKNSISTPFDESVNFGDYNTARSY